MQTSGKLTLYNSDMARKKIKIKIYASKTI